MRKSRKPNVIGVVGSEAKSIPSGVDSDHYEKIITPIEDTAKDSSKSSAKIEPITLLKSEPQTVSPKETSNPLQEKYEATETVTPKLKVKTLIKESYLDKNRFRENNVNKPKGYYKLREFLLESGILNKEEWVQLTRKQIYEYIAPISLPKISSYIKMLISEEILEMKSGDGIVNGRKQEVNFYKLK